MTICLHPRRFRSMLKVAILVGATLACVSGLVRAGPSGSFPLNSIN